MSTKNRTLGSEIERLRKKINNRQESGRLFESVFRDYLQSRSDVKNAWLRADWPDVLKHLTDKKDRGIDIVAEMQNGKLLAVQCKLIASESTSGTSPVGKLIGEAGPLDKPFSKLWWVTTGGFTPDAEKFIEKNRVHVFDLQGYWDEEIVATRKVREPFKLQKDAISQSVARLSKKGETRGKLIMACGTGKTYEGRLACFQDTQ